MAFSIYGGVVFVLSHPTILNLQIYSVFLPLLDASLLNFKTWIVMTMLKTFGPLLARAAMVAVGLTLSLAIAQWAGVRGTGYFFIAIAVMSGGILLLRGGLQEPLVRYLSIAFEEQRLAWFAQTHRYILIYCLGFGGLVSFGLAGLAPVLATYVFDDPVVSIHLQIISLAIPAMAYIWLLSSFFKSMNRPSLGLIFEFNGVATLALPLLFLLFISGRFSVANALAVFTGAAWVSFGIGLALFYVLMDRIRRESNHQELPAAPFGWSYMQDSYVPMLLANLSAYLLAMAPVVIVGATMGPEAAGIFAISNRIARVIIVINSVTNAVFGPRMARDYAQGEFTALEHNVRKAGVIAVGMALPLMAVVLIWPEMVLSLFGSDMAQTPHYLRLLVVGAFLEVALGPVGFALIMMGQEKTVRNVMLCFAGLFVVGVFLWSLSPSLNVFVWLVMATAVAAKLTMAAKFSSAMKKALK